MCTVTVMPWRGGLRLVHNRDERRSRPAAIPPLVVRAGGRLAVTPTDPVSGGTWVAANDAGLVFALLNVNPLTPPPGYRRRSRGAIIPAVLGSGGVEEAGRRFAELPTSDCAPFRLVVADRERVVAVTSLGPERREARYALDRPHLFTSSGLGDHLVEGPRRRLFEGAFAAGASAEAQDTFHRHSWRERPELSVWMSRPDACTVSQTTVEIARGTLRVVYSTSRRVHPGGPGLRGQAPPLNRLTEEHGS